MPGHASRSSPIPLWGKVGHDLRQPIQSLLLLAHVMAKTVDGAQRAETGRVMENALMALQEMLDAVALVARLEAGAEPIRTDRCDLAVVVAQAALRFKASNGGVPIAVKPARAEAVADRRLLEKALLGLLHYALASQADGETITLGCRVATGVGRIEVAFAGAPQTSAAQAALFIELGGGGAAGGHTIMGLPLIERMVVAAGGRMEHRSARGGRQLHAIVFDGAATDNHDT